MNKFKKMDLGDVYTVLDARLRDGGLEINLRSLVLGFAEDGEALDALLELVHRERQGQVRGNVVRSES